MGFRLVCCYPRLAQYCAYFGAPPNLNRCAAARFSAFPVDSSPQALTHIKDWPCRQRDAVLMMSPVRSFSRLLGLLALLLLCCSRAEDHWPRFRGPNGSGLASGSFPTTFGPDTNLAWQVEVPPGHSSPSISRDDIFLSAFSQARLSLIALERSSGSLKWTRELDPGLIEKGSHLSHPATATPATDGNFVVFYFASYGLVCLSTEGRLIWEKKLPVPILQHGAGTSPVIFKDKLLLACDNDLDSYLLCVSLSSGETLWKTPRPGFKRGFSTPLLYPPSNPSQIVLPGSLKLVSYNLADGTERWSVPGLPNEMVSSPICSDSRIFVAGWTHGSGVKQMPSFESLLAHDSNQNGTITRSEAPAGPAKQHFVYLDANKDAELTREEYLATASLFDKSENVALGIDPGHSGEPAVLWRFRRGLPYCPSLLLVGNNLYLVKNGGLVTCLNAATGEAHFQEERLGALGDYYASPVAAGGKICAISHAGTAVVFNAGESLEVLARNELGEQVVATPAIVDNILYIRTAKHLYAFREGPATQLSLK